MTRTEDDLASPYELMAQIQRDARDLDQGGRQLARSIRELGAVEHKYKAALESQLITIFHEYKEKGERMPAEDIRNALAHKQVNPAIYAAYLTKTAEVEALRSWTRTTASALSARQSLLACLRAEIQAPVS
jgi:hypothetical protein